MSKLKQIDSVSIKGVGYSHYCPACGREHTFYTKHPNSKYNWRFNGDMEYPTFTPSMLIFADDSLNYPRCHYFIKKGRIQYLSDSTHLYSGKTIDLLDYD